MKTRILAAPAVKGLNTELYLYTPWRQSKVLFNFVQMSELALSDSIAYLYHGCMTFMHIFTLTLHAGIDFRRLQTSNSDV